MGGTPVGRFGINAGASAVIETAYSTDLSCYCQVVRAATSEFIRNGASKVTTTVGSNNITKGIEIGGYANLDTACCNFDFYELIIYSGAHTGYEKMQVMDYLQERYATNFGVMKDSPYNLKEKYDGIMLNSVDYKDETTYKRKMAFAKYEFYTTDTNILIKANPTLQLGGSGSSLLTVFIDNVYFAQYYLYAFTEKIIFLPVGNKKVTLMEGTQAGVSGFDSVVGTFLTSVKCKNITKINEVSHPEKLVCIGDSISVSDAATIPETQGFVRLFEIENSKNIASLGFGFGQIKHFAGTSPLVTRTIGYLTSLFALTTTRKIVLIEAATNDWGVANTAAATFEGYYAALLDAIHTLDATIEVFCLSPLIRGDAKEDATLDDYRTRIASLCTARSTYCTHIVGKTILTYPDDFANAVHPHTAGHKKLKDAVYAVIYP
jgi:hypothetical protein